VRLVPIEIKKRVVFGVYKRTLTKQEVIEHLVTLKLEKSEKFNE
jgi:hypothetical protein